MRYHGRQNLLNIIIGSLAVSVSLYFVVIHRADFTIVAASFFFSLICFTDCLYGKIPNLVNATLTIIGFALNSYASGFSGALFSLAGIVVGIALLLLPFLMGGFGAGDVKALGALGALIGPYALLHVFVYMAFFGGGFALLYNLFSDNPGQKLQECWSSVKASVLTRDYRNLKSNSHDQRRQLLRFPYATAIAFGYYTFITWGGVL